MDQKQIWNQSSVNIPLDKDPSNYAVEKEKLFPRNSIVCDLGGGSGADTVYFLKKGHKVILADISNIALERAKLKAKELGFSDGLQTIEVDFSEGKIPLNDNTFDVVFSRLALHYFYPEITTKLFKEIYRILKSNSKAYITVKSPKDEKEMAFLNKNAVIIENNLFDDSGQLKSRYDDKQLKQIIKNAEIDNFVINDYEESFKGRVDRVKSGLDSLLLTEIILSK